MPDPLRHVRALAGPRESAGPGEAAAARYIAEAARAYTHQVWQEPFASFRSPLLAYVPVLGLALAGVLSLLVSPHLAAVLTVVAAALYAGQALRWIELGWLFRRARGGSQNVVAVVPSAGAIRRRLILISHTDSAWGPSGLPWWGRSASDTGAPGAAVALAAGEALARAPLRHTEVWTVFTGCRAPGLVGLRIFLQAYGPMLADADFLVLDHIRDGHAAFALGEAGFPILSADPDLAGMLGELGVSRRRFPPRPTQAALLLDEGFRAVTLFTTGPGPAPPRLLHEFVRILSALGDAIDRDARVEAQAEPGGM